jgi:hypothetical protein
VEPRRAGRVRERLQAHAAHERSGMVTMCDSCLLR